MPRQPTWSPAWCPGCSALVVQWVVALLPPPERHSWLESDYLVCPRCEAVTVSLPRCLPERAHVSLEALARARWSAEGLTELQRAVGRAKTLGPGRADDAIAAVARVHRPLRPILQEATERDELSNALLTLGLLLDMIQGGLRSRRPRARSRGAETRRLGELIEELRGSLEEVLGRNEGTAGDPPASDRMLEPAREAQHSG